MQTKRKTRRELRQFGLIMCAGCAVIGGILLWHGKPAAPYLLSVAGLFLVTGLVLPTVLRPFEWLWMKLALVLGHVMTFVVLTLTFYLVITPLGLLMRLLGKRPLALGFDHERSSFWEPVDADGPWGRPDKPF